MLRSHGNTVVSIFEHGQVDVRIFGSVKEAVQHYLSRASVDGWWGSAEHLAALEETKALLDRTIDVVRRDVEDSKGE
jgi:hypothetical protein